MDYFHETIKVPEQFLAWVYLQSENCITDVKKHWHRSLEISYIIKGSCLFEINGHELEAHPHDIMLINSCDIHGCHTNYHSESEMLSIIFPYSFLMAVFPTFNNYRYIVHLMLIINWNLLLRKFIRFSAIAASFLFIN